MRDVKHRDVRRVSRNAPRAKGKELDPGFRRDDELGGFRRNDEKRAPSIHNNARDTVAAQDSPAVAENPPNQR